MSRAPFVFIGSFTAWTRIVLAPLDQVGDLLPVPLALELGHDDLVDVQEAVLLEADLDERRLHPGQDVVDGAEVDVPGDRPPLGPLEVDLGDAVVLEQRDPLLADVDRDQELALRLRQRRPARRLASALTPADRARGRSALLRGAVGRCASAFVGGRLAARRGLLAPPSGGRPGLLLRGRLRFRGDGAAWRLSPSVAGVSSPVSGACSLSRLRAGLRASVRWRSRLRCLFASSNLNQGKNRVLLV